MVRSLWSLAVLAFGLLSYLAAQQVYEAELAAAGRADGHLGVGPLGVLSLHAASLGVWLILLLGAALLTVRLFAERLRLDSRRLDSERRYEAIFQNSSDAILLTSPDGGILDANPAAVAMFGFSVDRLRALGRGGVVDTSDPRLAPGLVERERTGRWRGELRMRRQDGRMFPAEIVSTVFIEASGARRTSMIIRDVTERVEAHAELQRRDDELVEVAEALRKNNVELEATTAQLQRANAAQRDFIAFVSHEFRTPLTTIQGFSEMIGDADLRPDVVREYAGYINEQAKRLGRLVTQLLDLDRMESGVMVLRKEPVDLGELASDLARQFALTAPGHRIRTSADGGVVVRGDPDRLTEVVSNLLSNAVKYSPEGGEVVVRVWREDATARLSVADEGLGIPTEMLETVFERFVRVGEATDRGVIRGTGLGLPIVRRIAELHGGRAWAESAQGKGSTLHVSLPAAP